MGTWWIDEPRLMGSSNPSVAALERLRSDGFDVLVSFLKEDEQPPRYDVEQVKAFGFERHNIPVRDFHPPAVEQLEQFVTLIAQIPATAKAVVHCEGGIGRTGTFAAAYWVAKGQTVPDAIARVRQVRPGAVETQAQEEVLRRFAAVQMRSGHPESVSNPPR
jgi:atypical dual specificity phosphatase